MNYVYILECADGSLYTGWTNNIYKRFMAHQSGHGAKYTRSHWPLRIVHLEMYEDASEARKREYAIKRMSHKEKQQLTVVRLKKERNL